MGSATFHEESAAACRRPRFHDIRSSKDQLRAKGSAEDMLPPHPKIQIDSEGHVFLNFGEYGLEVEVACFSGDGTRLLTVRDVGEAQIWDLATSTLISTLLPTSPLTGTSGTAPIGGSFVVFIEAAALDATGRHALLGLNDGTAGLYRVADGERLAIFHDPAVPAASYWEPIRAVAYAPGDALALVGFFDRTIGIWDAASQVCRAILRHPDARRESSALVGPRSGLVSSVGISPDLRYAFAGYADGTASIWDIASERLVLDAYEHQEDILDLFVDDAAIRWATSGGTIWHLRRDGSAQGAPESAQAAVRLVHTGEHWGEAVFDRGGGSLLIHTGMGVVRHWAYGGDIETLAASAFPPAYGHERFIGFLGDDGSCFYPLNEHSLGFTVATGQICLHPPRPSRSEIPYTCVAAAPRGDILATVRWEEDVEIWDAHTGQLHGRLASRDGVGAMSFSPDGRLLAVGAVGKRPPGARRDIVLWDVASKRARYRLRGHTHQIAGIAFGPGARWVVTASVDGTVCLWHLPVGGRGKPAKARQRRYSDLDGKSLRVLADGRVLIFRESVLEVWRDLETLLCQATIPNYYSSGVRWRVAADEQSIFGTLDQQGIAQWSLRDGTLMGTFRPDIIRPEALPTAELGAQLEARDGCFLWHGPGGPYLHVGDGPRGWATPIGLSHDRLRTVIPCAHDAAILDLGPPPTLEARVPFTGKLRASTIVADRVLIVNEKGTVFHAQGEWTSS
jgi:WD40 repeat protein